MKRKSYPSLRPSNISKFAGWWGNANGRHAWETATKFANWQTSLLTRVPAFTLSHCHLDNRQTTTNLTGQVVGKSNTLGFPTGKHCKLLWIALKYTHCGKCVSIRFVDNKSVFKHRHQNKQKRVFCVYLNLEIIKRSRVSTTTNVIDLTCIEIYWKHIDERS